MKSYGRCTRLSVFFWNGKGVGQVISPGELMTEDTDRYRTLSFLKAFTSHFYIVSSIKTKTHYDEFLLPLTLRHTVLAVPNSPENEF